MARYRSDDGARHQKALGPADDALDATTSAVLTFDQAQGLAREWFSTLDRHHGRRPSRYSVGQALDDYLEAFTGKSKAKTAWAVDRYLRPTLQDTELSELTTEKIATFLRELATTPGVYRAKRNGKRKQRPIDVSTQRARRASANRVFAVLKAALNRAYADGKIGSDESWRKVKPFAKVDSPRIHYLSATEAVHLVAAADLYFRPLIQAALLTGARWSELCRMRVRDVDLVAGVILIPETKAGRPRYVHLSEEGVSLFRATCASKALGDFVFTNQHGRAYGASHQSRPMRAACDGAGIQPAGFHILRHTYGSRLAMAGVPLAVIAEALGHGDERITRKHYAHLSPSYVRDAIRGGLGTMGVYQPEAGARLKLVS